CSMRRLPLGTALCFAPLAQQESRDAALLNPASFPTCTPHRGVFHLPGSSRLREDIDKERRSWWDGATLCIGYAPLAHRRRERNRKRVGEEGGRALEMGHEHERVGVVVGARVIDARRVIPCKRVAMGVGRRGYLCDAFTSIRHPYIERDPLLHRAVIFV